MPAVVPSFLDIESTSLSADMGMLVCSVIRTRGKDSLFFVDSPRNERRVLDRLCAEIRKCDTLVTFNGRSFDLPFIVSRRLVLGARDLGLSTARHVDLFDHCRQILRFDKFSLDHIARVLGIEVDASLTGREIPHLYNTYLANRSRQAKQQIMDHCVSDVRTLEKVYLRLEPLLTGEGVGP